MSLINELLLLFDHPQEPVFIPKGRNQTVFDIPVDYFADKYKPLSAAIVNRFAQDAKSTVRVKKIAPPSLEDVLKLQRDDNFSLFLPKHRDISARLIDMFLKTPSLDDLLAVAVFARDRINPYLFNYCLSVAMLHRSDLVKVDLPSFIRIFPDKYMDSKIFGKAREELTILPEGSRTPMVLPKYTPDAIADPESRLAYFREDVGVNLHHWHWHLVYPLSGGRKVVSKDRRGELFYYMHQQIIARYNFERLCNRLKRVRQLNDYSKPIEEGYNANLTSAIASRSYPARAPNQTMKNLNRPDDNAVITVDELKRWRDRIIDAIHKRRLIDENGKAIPLTERDGIDILGNTLEASDLSANKSFYGDLHNMGHTLLAYIHDPENINMEKFAVMGDVATAMRDPVFYRWHAHIDDIFQQYKNMLPPYQESQLAYPGITLRSVEIKSKGATSNQFNTFWQQSDVDLSRGMDFQQPGNVFVRLSHLQHRNFTYNVTVTNTTIGTKLGTCRIFLAPKYDEFGREWSFRDQKLFFIELDKFTITLKQGTNLIIRQSQNSSVTIPFERTFRDLDTNRPGMGTSDLDQFNFCGCGWPHNLLLPRGTSKGMPCQLFVMVSDYEGDKVEQDMRGICNDAGSYCGIKDKLYPDRRAMGYPFDRLPRKGVDTLNQFLTTNMCIQDVVVKFTDSTVAPNQSA